MPRDPMADNRLDLAAPLPSVRRAEAAPLLSVRRDASRATLPFYKPDLKSGPVRHPGAVPFVWEHRPGQPKPSAAAAAASKGGSSVRTRRPRPPPSAPARSQEEREEESETSSQENARAEAAVAPEGDLKAIGDATAKSSSVEVPAGEGEEELVETEATEVVERDKVVVAAQEEDDEEEEDRFSDALDTLSRTESFAMNCSISGLSGVPDPAASAAAGPDARGFMMDRFLPAAQAVAVGSPMYTFRKASNAAVAAASTRDSMRLPPANAPGSNGDSRPRRLPVQLPYQHLPPNGVSYGSPKHEEHEEEEDEEDEEDYDAHSTRHFASKGCGLLPRLCMKSSFLLLNPVPAMKPRGGCSRGRGLLRRGRGRGVPSPLARSSQNGHLGRDPDEQSWEAVYKHNGQRHQGQGKDGRSKLTSESNQLTYWSDSQTADGSSPFRRSTGGGASPYHSDVAFSLSNQGIGPVGPGNKDEKMSRSDGSVSFGRDCDSVSFIGSDHGSLRRSGSQSSGPSRTVNEDSMDHLEDIDTKASHLDMVPDTMAVLNTSKQGPELQGGTQIVEATDIVKCQDNDSSTQKISEVREPALPMPSKSLGPGKLDVGTNFRHEASQGYRFNLEDKIIVKKEVSPLQSILPLPLPKSPSESWLSRTLPSVSSKKPPMPYFLGIHVQHKKQAPWASMDPKKENHVKPSRPRQIRFAEGLEKPNALNAEI